MHHHRARVGISQARSAVLLFLDEMGQWLTMASTALRNCQYEEAVKSLKQAVDLCELNPSYAVIPASDGGPNPLDMLRDSVRQAVGNRRYSMELFNLQRRLDYIPRSGPH